MKRLSIAVAAATFACSSMAASPCDQYAYYVDTLAGRQIVYSPTYEKCMSAQWAASVGKAAGLKGPNSPEMITQRDEELKRKEAQNARTAEMHAKVRAINDEYNAKETNITGIIGSLYNGPKEAERNEKLTAVGDEYGYDWDASLHRFTKKSPQQIDERARELEFMAKVKEIKAQYPPEPDQPDDAQRLKERNDKVIALAHDYGYEWDLKTGQFFKPQPNSAVNQ